MFIKPSPFCLLRVSSHSTSNLKSLFNPNLIAMIFKDLDPWPPYKHRGQLGARYHLLKCSWPAYLSFAFNGNNLSVPVVASPRSYHFVGKCVAPQTPRSLFPPTSIGVKEHPPIFPYLLSTPAIQTLTKRLLIESNLQYLINTI